MERNTSTAKKKQNIGYPILKTVEQMSEISGLGESKLRELMENRELEYVENGNRRLITNKAIMEWYERNKVPAYVPKQASKLRLRKVYGDTDQRSEEQA